MLWCFSDWQSVTSVPQGTVLRLLFIVLHINGLDRNVDGMFSKFTADINIRGLIDGNESYRRI